MLEAASATAGLATVAVLEAAATAGPVLAVAGTFLAELVAALVLWIFRVLWVLRVLELHGQAYSSAHALSHTVQRGQLHLGGILFRAANRPWFVKLIWRSSFQPDNPQRH